MITSVHGEKLKTCQHTGESFKHAAFKIPVPTNARVGNKKWTGSYGSPSAALAGITAKKSAEWKEAMNEEEWNQVLVEFNNSLHRKAGMETENPSFVIDTAPPHTQLEFFGGNLKLEAFHAIYNHDFQVRAIEQHIKEEEIIEAASDGEEDAPNSPKPWRYTKIDKAMLRDDLLPKPDIAKVPRCLGKTLQWLRWLFEDLFHEQWTEVVMYNDPHDPKKFACGTLKAALDGETNRVGADVMKTGARAVFGNIGIIHKAEALKVRKGKRKAAIEALDALTIRAADESASKKKKKAAGPTKRKLKPSDLRHEIIVPAEPDQEEEEVDVEEMEVDEPKPKPKKIRRTAEDGEPIIKLPPKTSALKKKKPVTIVLKRGSTSVTHKPSHI